MGGADVDGDVLDIWQVEEEVRASGRRAGGVVVGAVVRGWTREVFEPVQFLVGVALVVFREAVLEVDGDVREEIFVLVGEVAEESCGLARRR